jgi:hypothetical protein
MEKHLEWVFILFTKDQKRPKKFQNGDERFLLKSKNWTTLVKSTNEQIQCAKHGGVWKKGEKKKAKKA